MLVAYGFGKFLSGLLLMQKSVSLLNKTGLYKDSCHCTSTYSATSHYITAEGYQRCICCSHREYYAIYNVNSCVKQGIITDLYL